VQLDEYARRMMRSLLETIGQEFEHTSSETDVLYDAVCREVAEKLSRMSCYRSKRDTPEVHGVILANEYIHDQLFTAQTSMKEIVRRAAMIFSLIFIREVSLTASE
jgi:hypothetical protein